MTLNGDPVALQDVGNLLLPLVLYLFLLTLGVVLIVPVLMLVLGVAALKNKCLVVGCRACAGDFRRVPLAVGLAAYSWGVTLNEALLTLITEQGVDLIAQFCGPKNSGILHHRRLTA